MFAHWTWDFDGGQVGRVQEQSGGIVPGATGPLGQSGLLFAELTFPVDLEGCVAIATQSADDGIRFGLHPLTSSIEGRLVTVYTEGPSNSTMPDFSVAVFC
jgi:hypothetical protein